jgi:anti-sigma B factor antagonist
MHDRFRSEDGPDPATRSLVATGELDTAAATAVRWHIEEALDAGKWRVIVDLSEITYMETAAVASLLDANARLTRIGAKLVVVIPSDSRVRILFSVTNLDKVLRVADTREQALRAA